MLFSTVKEWWLWNFSFLKNLENLPKKSRKASDNKKLTEKCHRILKQRPRNVRGNGSPHRPSFADRGPLVWNGVAGKLKKTAISWRRLGSQRGGGTEISNIEYQKRIFLCGSAPPITRSLKTCDYSTLIHTVRPKWFFWNPVVNVSTCFRRSRALICDVLLEITIFSKQPLQTAFPLFKIEKSKIADDFFVFRHKTPSRSLIALWAI